MNNRYFKLIQVVVTSLAFYYFYNFFINEVNIAEIDFQLGTNSLLIITLFFLVNNLHSLGWSNFYTKDQNFSYTDTYLFAMKSHIGKYSFVKFGNFFIRLSQNYEQTKKKDFLTKALLEQSMLVVFGISFGIFHMLSTSSAVLVIFLVVILNFLLIYVFNKFNNKKLRSLIETKAFHFYFATAFLQFSSLSIFFSNVGFDKYFYFAGIYLFSSAISVVVSVIPAGLGVKESIFIYVSNEIISSTFFLNLLIELRILFIISDFLSYLYSVILLNKKN